MKKELIIKTVKLVIGLLSSHDYERIADLDFRRISTASGIKQAIEDYGGEVTIPPDTSFNEIDIYPLKGIENQVNVDFDLWINNEKSDLTLTVTIIKEYEDLYRYSVKGIRVL